MPGTSPRLSEGAIIEQGAVIARGLQYVNAWKGKTVVVKAGGSVLESGQGTAAQDVVLLKGAGIHPVLVHGAGPAITRLLERLARPSRSVQGLRVTDAATTAG